MTSTILHKGKLCKCCGLNTASSQEPHSCFPILSPSGLGSEAEGKRKHIDWNKDCLMRKTTVMHTRKAKQGVTSLLPMGTQEFSHLQEDQDHHSKCLPHSSFFLPLYIPSMTSYGREYLFGQLGSSVPAVPHPIIPWTPSFLTSALSL